MSAKSPSDAALKVSGLSQAAPTPFSLRPDKAVLDRIATDLDLSALRKLSFEGTLAPQGKRDWLLTARLGATVVQPCVATLEPVTTRIDEDVMRIFLSDFVESDESEVEIPEDETSEPLGTWIDPAAVMVETLALALPEYPRAADAAPEERQFTEPGKAPMTDEDARPFAGLAALKDKLKGDDE